MCLSQFPLPEVGLDEVVAEEAAGLEIPEVDDGADVEDAAVDELTAYESEHSPKIIP